MGHFDIVVGKIFILDKEFSCYANFFQFYVFSINAGVYY